MDDFGGLESGAPSEGNVTGNEALSEEKRQAFAGATQAIQQIRKEEKQAKKRDDGVASVILQFLTDEQRTHLATLISRMVALNCPSHFILAILSLMNEQCQTAVDDYLKARVPDLSTTTLVDPALFPAGQLDASADAMVAQWIARLDAILSFDAQNILNAIIIEERNIDGTVLQLTTFVLEEFFQKMGKAVAFEKLQPVAIGVLQSVLASHMQAHIERRIAEAPVKEEE